MNAFLAALEKINQGIIAGVAIGQQLAPVLGAIPTAGPIILTAISIVSQLETMFPQANLGASKLPLAVAHVTTVHPEISSAQAAEVVSAIVTDAKAIAASPQKA